MLKIGDKAPGFSLLSGQGKKVSLKDFKGKRVILFFYPKDMTPGCTTEACDFRDLKPKLSRKKTVVLGVSKDSVERHKKFIEKNGLNFDLLSDEKGKTLEDYEVWKEKSLYGKKFMGIVRTTYVIGPTGKIEKIYPKVKVKGHAETVFGEL